MARRFVVKHVQLNLAAGFLVRAFPTSPAVIVLRHPCAVVQSRLSVGWKARTPEEHLTKVSPEQVRETLELLDGRTSEAAHYGAGWAASLALC